jgi:hypothetical protein
VSQSSGYFSINIFEDLRTFSLNPYERNISYNSFTLIAKREKRLLATAYLFLSRDLDRFPRDLELSLDFFDFSYDRDRDRFLCRSTDLDLFRDLDLDLKI